MCDNLLGNITGQHVKKISFEYKIGYSVVLDNKIMKGSSDTDHWD